jgi:uncharacterized protein YndB with AHSA1/START domain
VTEATDETPLAEVSRDGGFVVAQTHRAFDHPPEALWQALTEPAMLAQWLAPGRIELKAGGAARLDFTDSGTVIDSKVSAFEAGRVLEYSWSHGAEPHRPVRWEVTPRDGGATLTLTLKTPEGEDAARAFAGWEAHLEMLEAALEGVPIKFPFERFKAAREAYKGRVAALYEGGVET